jgi:probable HAF family extracellular repeat protein
MLLVASGPASAQAWLFTDLGGPGGAFSTARSINDAGQVAGSADAADGTRHAILWSDGNATDLGPGYANGINNAAQVVGSTTDSDEFASRAILWDGARVTDLGRGVAFAINDAGEVAGGAPAFVWRGGTRTELGEMDNQYLSYALAINDTGQAAGYSVLQYGTTGPSDQSVIPVLWSGTDAMPLPSLGVEHSGIYDINNSAVMVGRSELPITVEGAHFGDEHAAMWNNGTAIDLGTLGGELSNAYAINDSNQTVGWSLMAEDNSFHAAMWSDGEATDLNSFLDASTVAAGWHLIEAFDINNKGWIVGDAYNAELGVHHAFLLTPVPEPATYLMLLAGLGLLGLAIPSRSI